MTTEHAAATGRVDCFIRRTILTAMPAKFVTFDNGTNYFNVDQIVKIEASSESTTTVYLSDGKLTHVRALARDMVNALNRAEEDAPYEPTGI